MPETPTRCFHCGEPLTGRSILWIRIRASDEAVCCPGCRAAAQLIAELGLEDFYRFRTEPSARPRQSSAEWLAYDEPQLLDALTRKESDGRTVSLLIDGLTCAACSWLITRALLKIDGVRRASVNLATGRAQVAWDDAKAPLSRLLREIAELGYRPQPATFDAAAAQAQHERHAILKRLAVSGLGMMQVMMFAVALYAGEWHGMDAGIRSYLRIVSLIVATPVMLYAGWPFLRSAFRALRLREITMDVPVSVGLVLAYGASVFNTWRHAGAVYFDSVTMFIFFLTVARFIEMTARHRCTSVTDALSRVLPASAHRVTLTVDGEAVKDVAVAQLRVGDLLLVRAGEALPADGEITAGGARIDESMLSGESLPVARGPGDKLIAGTINTDAPLQMRITALGAATVLSSIVRLLNRALAERPRITLAADQWASRFLACVLIGATLVFAAWSWVDASRALAATLSVLVAACPCALSLATLVAVASANSALARRGVLVTHADAIEGLAKVSRVIFDKTGTLTDGAIRITNCTVRGPLSKEQCFYIAAALEANSEHPIARAFAGTGHAARLATDVRIAAGAGVEGVVDGERYRIGTRAFVDPGASIKSQTSADSASIALGDARGVLATFMLGDRSRPECADTVGALRDQGLELEIQSGDCRDAVARVARQCGIITYSARQTPLQKLQRLRSLTDAGEFVAMVGDGINDAPVLGGAGVSIAMGRGSGLAQASADLILVGDSLRALPEAFEVARRARGIIRQNLLWAGIYNLTAMPLAAVGWVPPWAAAIGMSASSVLVVLNSLRLMQGAPRSNRSMRDAGRATAPALTPPTAMQSLIRSS